MALANARRRKAIEHFVETTVVIRQRADEVEPARYRFRFGQKRPPAAGIACNALEHGIGIAAEPDRQMRILHRLGFEHDIPKRNVATFEGWPLLGPWREHSLDVLIGHGHQLIKVDTGRAACRDKEGK